MTADWLQRKDLHVLRFCKKPFLLKSSQRPRQRSGAFYSLHVPQAFSEIRLWMKWNICSLIKLVSRQLFQLHFADCTLAASWHILHFSNCCILIWYQKIAHFYQFQQHFREEVFSFLFHNWKNIQRSWLSRFAERSQIMKSGRSLSSRSAPIRWYSNWSLSLSLLLLLSLLLSLRSAPIRWCSNWPMSAKQSQDWRQQEKSILHWGRQVCLCSVAYRWEHVCHTGTWWYACPPPRSHWSTSGRLLLIYQLPGLSAYRVDGRAIPCSVNPLPAPATQP